MVFVINRACSRFETGRGVLQSQDEIDELCLDLVNGLSTEVTDVHQVSFTAGHELTHGVDALALEAVVRTLRQVEVLYFPRYTVRFEPERIPQLTAEEVIDAFTAAAADF